MSAAPEPAASVVVATYQRAAAVGRLLEALDAQTCDPACFEVVVVADGSTDGTRELVDGFSARFALRCAWQENAGRAAASNHAIRLARGALLIILDDDMVASPGLVAAHLAAHADEREPRFVMGPAPIALGPDPRPFLRYMATTRNEHYARLAEPGHVFHVRDLYSGNASVRRDVLLGVGGFDEALPQLRGRGRRPRAQALRRPAWRSASAPRPSPARRTRRPSASSRATWSRRAATP